MHRLVHAYNDIAHAPCDLTHRYRGLDSTADGIDARRESEKIESLILFANGVLRVNLGNITVALLHGLDGISFVSRKQSTGVLANSSYLLELVLLSLLVLAGFGGLTVELLCGELRPMSDRKQCGALLMWPAHLEVEKRLL